MRDKLASTEVIKRAVQLACRAPSLHNSQPWHWVADAAAVHLYREVNRVLYGTDHSGRQALLSCGAALDHFRVAMAAAGWRANIDRFPNPNNRLHLASVDFSPIELVTEGHRLRADAILARRTDRLPFAEPDDWKSVEPQLVKAVTSDAVRIDMVPDELRADLVNASQLTQSLRLYDSEYHAELTWWTGPFEASEGVPYSALISASENERVDIGRRFPVTSGTDRRAGYGPDRSKIVVLSTFDTDRRSVLECGEMLSAVLLEATMAGLATCTLTHITELEASRNIVASLIEQTTTPQVLIRIGVVPEVECIPPPTPRRPMSEVFEVRPSTSE